MNKRTEALIIVVAATVVASTIAYSAYQSTQNQLEVAFNYPNNGVSVFDIPETRINGTSVPLYNDTSEKQIIFATPENVTSERFVNAMPVGTTFDFCRTREAPYDRLGEDSNAAVVRIGAKEPTVIPFCAHNFTTQEPQLLYLRIREVIASNIPDGADYDNVITGLNFALNTRTIDMPGFFHYTPDGEFIDATLVVEHIYLNVSANMNAQEGVHVFTLDAMEPMSKESGGGFGIQGVAVYVKVTK